MKPSLRGPIGVNMKALTLISVFTSLILQMSCVEPACAAEKKYIGPLPCAGECHKEVFDTWKSSKHATAFGSLASGAREKEKKEAGLKPGVDYQKDKSCLPCHVTGWIDGGYSFENPDPYLQGVGCESCHGAAGRWNEPHQKKDLENRKRHLKQKGQREPFKGKYVCVGCHEEDTNPYKFRSPPGKTDWTEPKHAASYHALK